MIILQTFIDNYKKSIQYCKDKLEEMENKKQKQIMFQSIEKMPEFYKFIINNDKLEVIFYKITEDTLKELSSITDRYYKIISNNENFVYLKGV